MALSRSTAAVRRRINGLGSLHRLLDMHDPTRAVAVVLALKRMHRQQGRAQVQAVPLTQGILEKLLEACSPGFDGQRNIILLHLGHEAMRRCAELCEFRFDDLQTLATGKSILNMRFSKTDQYGEGWLIAISPMLAGLIHSWGERIGREGYILRSVRQQGSGIGKQLSPSSINQILVKLQMQAGLTLERNLSGHSFRVGAAVDMFLAGKPWSGLCSKAAGRVSLL